MMSQQGVEAQKTLKETKSRHNDEIQTLQRGLKTQMEVKESDLQSATNRHEDCVQQWRAWCELLQAEHDGQMEQAENAFEERLQTEQLAVERENERLKGALAKREHTKAWSDQEVCNAFKALAREVNNFARLPWERRKQNQWPLPESVLAHADNPKKLKQMVIQSSVWPALHDRLFCTPLALIGDEGRKIHQDWVYEFGKGM
jgi:hypothetical protein